MFSQYAHNSANVCTTSRIFRRKTISRKSSLYKQTICKLNDYDTHAYSYFTIFNVPFSLSFIIE